MNEVEDVGEDEESAPDDGGLFAGLSWEAEEDEDAIGALHDDAEEGARGELAAADASHDGIADLS